MKKFFFNKNKIFDKDLEVHERDKKSYPTRQTWIKNRWIRFLLYTAYSYMKKLWFRSLRDQYIYKEGRDLAPSFAALTFSIHTNSSLAE